MGSRGPAQPTKSTAWTPCDLICSLPTAQEWRPDHRTKALSFVQKSANGVPCAPPPCGHQEGAPQASPRAVCSRPGGPRERLQGPGRPGVRGSGGCRSEAARRASPDTRKGAACVLPSHRRRGLASPLMSGLQGLLSSSGLQERASRGRRLHNFPAVGVEERASSPGPWAPAAWAPWGPARRPVRRWPGSRSESTAALASLPSLSLKQAFLVSSPWQLYN